MVMEALVLTPSFANALDAVAPGRLRYLMMAAPPDGPLFVSPKNGPTQPRVFTPSATLIGRYTQLGNGWSVSFNGTSNQITTPDTADMSFGNGTTDSPFSGVVLASPTNQTTQRGMFGKYGTGASGNREYLLNLEANEKVQFFLYDASANAQPIRTATIPVATGAFQTLGWSYNGVGGATAANGILMTVNGVDVLSSATNDATYVAMEDKAALPNIGGGQSTGGGAGADEFFAGSIAFAAVYATYLSPPQHARIKTAVNRFYGLAL